MPEKSNYVKLWKIGIWITLSVNLIILFFLFLNGKGVFTSEVTRNNYLYEGGTICFISPNLPVLPYVSAIGFLLVVLIIIVSCVLVVIGRIKSKMIIGGKISLNLLLLFVTLIISFISLLSYDGDSLMASESDYFPEYYEFSNENRKIVICEESYMLGGYGAVYQIYDDNTAWCIGQFTTDDGYRNHGKYQINWADDGMTLTYDNGSGLGEKKYSEKYFAWVAEE